MSLAVHDVQRVTVSIPRQVAAAEWVVDLRIEYEFGILDVELYATDPARLKVNAGARAQASPRLRRRGSRRPGGRRGRPLGPAPLLCPRL